MRDADRLRCHPVKHGDRRQRGLFAPAILHRGVGLGLRVAHRRLDPAGLPRRFKEWERRAQQIERAVQAQGLAVHRVEVDPHALAAWCAARHADINSQTRAAFAAMLGGTNQNHG